MGGRIQASWFIVNDLAPDEDGTLMLNFSTPPESDYAFNLELLSKSLMTSSYRIPFRLILFLLIRLILFLSLLLIRSIRWKASIKVFPNPVQRDFVITFYNTQVE